MNSDRYCRTRPCGQTELSSSVETIMECILIKHISGHVISHHCSVDTQKHTHTHTHTETHTLTHINGFSSIINVRGRLGPGTQIWLFFIIDPQLVNLRGKHRSTFQTEQDNLTTWFTRLGYLCGRSKACGCWPRGVGSSPRVRGQWGGCL